MAQNLQVSGFGTRLMAWTKRHARDRDDCQFFVTYADNNAVGYFSKQGFSKTISMDRERWHGYIKDYDGGTLMECAIHPTLPFTDTPAMILHQKAAIEGEVGGREKKRGGWIHSFLGSVGEETSSWSPQGPLKNR